MNKKELVEKIENMPYDYGILMDFVKLNRGWILKSIKQLEPEKVKVSEEEAKFLETFDFSHDFDVTTALYYVSRTGWGYHLTDKDGTELKHLTREARLPKNRKRLIKAILDGYEVEKEKRYLVKMKGIEKEKCYLNYNFGGVWLFYNQENFYGYRAHHTRKELEEAGFGWVFDCPGIEVEEVE